ncbi:hypothetical protein Tco_0255085 [Tanacetum coccineum]
MKKKRKMVKRERKGVGVLGKMSNKYAKLILLKRNKCQTSRIISVMDPSQSWAASQLPDNEISDPHDHPNDDDDNMVEDEPELDVSNLTGK